MSIREAAIRVNMKAQGFLTGLRQMLQETDLVSKKMERKFKVVMGRSFQAGIKSSKEALKDLGSGIKETMGNAATLGGAIGTGAMINNAMQLQEVYSQVAFQLERATGKAHSLGEVQSFVVSAAKETKRTHEELGTAMAVMLDKGTDPTFAIQSLQSVGHVMNATGKEANQVGRLLSGMSIKFGLNGREAAGMLDQVLAASSKGKLSMEEYMEDFNEFGSIAKTAGFGGKEGLGMMLGLITKMGPALNGSTGEISAGLDILFERLRDVGIVEGILKAAKPSMKFDKAAFAALGDAQQKMEYLAKAGPEAMALFRESFTGREETAAIEAYMGPYFTTMQSELKKGKKKTEAHLEAMKVLKSSQTDLKKPFAEQGSVMRQSAAIQETSGAKVRTAMNILSEAMTQPQMLDALDSLAKNMPTLASGFAKLIGFVVKHPALAGAMAIGGKAGLSFASGALGEAGSRIGKDAAKALAKDIKSVGPWKAAGAAIGIAAAAFMAYEGGKALIDSMYEAQGKELGGAVASEAQASAVAGGKDIGAKESALASIQAQIAKAKADQGGFTGAISGAANATFGALAGVGASMGLNDEVKYTDTRADSVAKLEAAERELRDSIDKQKRSSQGVSQSGDKAASSLDTLSESAVKFAKIVDKLGGGAPPKPGNTGPGYNFEG